MKTGWDWIEPYIKRHYVDKSHIDIVEDERAMLPWYYWKFHQNHCGLKNGKNLRKGMCESERGFRRSNQIAPLQQLSSNCNTKL